jgi:hypothetical protein
MEINRDDLIEKIINSQPGVEWSTDSFWDQWGHYSFGIYEGYIWNRLALGEASDLELWKILALCQDYWLKKYKCWLQKLEEKSASKE